MFFLGEFSWEGFCDSFSLVASYFFFWGRKTAQGSYISAAELFHELFFVVVVDRTWNIGTVFPSPDQKKGHYSVISWIILAVVHGPLKKSHPVQSSPT